MVNGDKKVLKCSDAFGIMCGDIRAIARQLEFGTLKFPNSDNPSMIMEVHDGVVKQIDIVLHGKNSIDKTKRYR